MLHDASSNLQQRSSPHQSGQAPFRAVSASVAATSASDFGLCKRAPLGGYPCSAKNCFNLRTTMLTEACFDTDDANARCATSVGHACDQQRCSLPADVPIRLFLYNNL